jgi:hypothetical protein
MKKSRILLDETFNLDARYRVILYVLEVQVEPKYPKGIKAKFLLLDLFEEVPRLLVDNHEPFGFHIHTGLPADKSKREIMGIVDYQDALRIFLDEVQRIAKYEKK